MLGFEMFDVREWLDGAFVKPAPRAEGTTIARRRSGKLLMSVTFAVAAAFGAPVAFASEATPSAIAVVDQPASTSLKGSEVPHGYWTYMAAEVAKWQPSSAAEIDYPLDAFI